MSPRAMQPSTVKTMTVPNLGVGAPAVITYASKVPIRVVVRNVGPVNIFFAHTAQDVNIASNTQATFLIPPNSEATFVLAPEQGCHAAGSGAIGLISVAISEAWPTAIGG